MSATPAYAATAKCPVVQVTAANTNRDGTGTLATVYTAGASGSRIDRINIKAVGVTTAGFVRLYIHDGTNSRLFTEVAVTAATPSATVASFEKTLEAYSTPSLIPLILQTGYSLRASTEKGETFNVLATGGDN